MEFYNLAARTDVLVDACLQSSRLARDDLTIAHIGLDGLKGAEELRRIETQQQVVDRQRTYTEEDELLLKPTLRNDIDSEDLLWVGCSSECSGVFERRSRNVNGTSIWKERHTGNRTATRRKVLYSTKKGTWMISDTDRAVANDQGCIQSKRHCGRPPTASDLVWKIFNGTEWCECAVDISSKPPVMPKVILVNNMIFVKSSKFSNNLPVWTRGDVLLHSSISGCWLISSPVQLFHHSNPHCLTAPDNPTLSWHSFRVSLSGVDLNCWVIDSSVVIERSTDTECLIRELRAISS